MAAHDSRRGILLRKDIAGEGCKILDPRSKQKETPWVGGQWASMSAFKLAKSLCKVSHRTVYSLDLLWLEP